jgi:hypothetical protein
MVAEKALRKSLASLLMLLFRKPMLPFDFDIIPLQSTIISAKHFYNVIKLAFEID